MDIITWDRTFIRKEKNQGPIYPTCGSTAINRNATQSVRARSEGLCNVNHAHVRTAQGCHFGAAFLKAEEQLTVVCVACPDALSKALCWATAPSTQRSPLSKHGHSGYTVFL